MKAGDLIRPIIADEEVNSYFMHIIDIDQAGFNVVILNGPHFGCKLFFPHPKDDYRRWEVIDESR